MPKHMQREIENLRKKIITLGAMVEENVYQAVKSFMQRNADEANNIIEADNKIDQMEIEIEEDCLKILALHQPVAIDLRFLIAVLKLNNDLERIGDKAVKIAERTINLRDFSIQEMPFDFSIMAEKVQSMLKKCLDAMVNMDMELAREVCTADDEVDSIHRETYIKVRNMVNNQPENIHYLLDFLSVSGCLERIADHATNIAEDVIYLIEGEIVRHKNLL